MPGVLDADTHIAESEAMWSYIEKEMYPRRPVLAKIPDDTWYKERNAFWLIDGEIFPKPAGKASFSLITPSAQKKESGRADIHLGVRELTDPMARLRDMDKIGVDVQVIYPTSVSGLSDRRSKTRSRAVPRLQPLHRQRVRHGAGPAQVGGDPAAARYRSFSDRNEMGERTGHRRRVFPRHGRQSDAG